VRIAVVGSRGQLGAAVVQELATLHDVVPFDRAALDVTDAPAVASVMHRQRPHAIVNCTAYNNVDAAEDHPVEALKVNAFAVGALARAAIDIGSVLVHFSTDFVFDGTTNRPYMEGDRPNPKSVYATSKLIGEWFAEDAPTSYVLRVASLFGDAGGGPAPKGTVASLIRALRDGEAARVFSDRTVSPTHVADAAWATRLLLERCAPAGLYHCVSTGFCTWEAFAREAARLLSIEPRLLVVSAADLRLRAPRPLYCAMSNRKLASIGIEMPTWQNALERFLNTEPSAAPSP